MSDYVYYRYRPDTNAGFGRLYRLSSNYWLGGEGVQQVFNWRTGNWVPTDMLVHRLIRGDLSLDRLDVDPTTTPLAEQGTSAVWLEALTDYLIDHPELIDDKWEREYAFSDVRRSFPSVLEELKTSGRRWVVIVETLGEPMRYVQVLITGAGSMWAECVSNAFLTEDDRLDDAQCELLPALGWEWPGPPASPNWHFHDELMNTGSAIAGLLERTIERVFNINGDDRIRVVIRPLVEKQELADQR